MIQGNVEFYNIAKLLPIENGVGKYIIRIPNNLKLTLNPDTKTNALCELTFNLKTFPLIRSYLKDKFFCSTDS